jgi:hypothetical protein
MIDSYTAIGVVVAIILISTLWAFIAGTNDGPVLTGVEKRFLAVLRSAVIWSAGFSLVGALVFAALAVLSFLVPLLQTTGSYLSLSGLGLFGGIGLLNLALTCFGSFVASMLVFIFVAVELHFRRCASDHKVDDNGRSSMAERKEPPLAV